ncbi:MAG TPA: ATP synthase F0 subunit C [Firmicutes bacterium]|nr:ATP synthase F0 subunit C [Bacillota bacterium]
MALVALIALCVVIGLVFGGNGSAFAEDPAADTGVTAPAEETNDAGVTDVGMKAIGAAIAVGVAAAAGAIGMGIAIAKSNESIARQPEAKADIRSSMMLGLVFIETAIIYALIVAILLIFVL